MGLNKKNFRQILIGKDVNKTGTTVDTLVEGELGLFTPSGTLLTAATAATADKAVVYLGTASGTPVKLSNTIIKDKIMKATAKNGSARVEQVDYVGFNGTSGALDTTNDNWFFVRLYLHELLVSNSDGRVVKHGQYKSPVSGTTQAGVAGALVKSLIKNFSREKVANAPSGLVKTEMLINNAGLALGTGTATAATVQATFGSTIISGWADVDDATTNAAMAVGDYLRFGTAVTDPVYKIVAIDATNDFLTLDVPYQGASALFNDTGLERIPAATAASADCGIKITGQPLSATPGKFIPTVVRWTTVLDGFASALVDESVGASLGVNTSELIAEQEHFLAGEKGDVFRDHPDAFPFNATVENILYDTISIRFKDEILAGAIYNVPEKELQIAIPATRSNDGYSAVNGYEDVFEAFLGITLGL